MGWGDEGDSGGLAAKHVDADGDRDDQAGNEAAWRNPGGGYAHGCVDWGPRYLQCAMDIFGVDQVFRLDGTALEALACAG